MTELSPQPWLYLRYPHPHTSGLTALSSLTQWFPKCSETNCIPGDFQNAKLSALPQTSWVRNWEPSQPPWVTILSGNTYEHTLQPKTSHPKMPTTNLRQMSKAEGLGTWAPVRGSAKVSGACDAHSGWFSTWEPGQWLQDGGLKDGDFRWGKAEANDLPPGDNCLALCKCSEP